MNESSTATEVYTAEPDESALEWLLYDGEGGSGRRPLSLSERADAFFMRGKYGKEYNPQVSTDEQQQQQQCEHESYSRIGECQIGTGISFVDKVLRHNAEMMHRRCSNKEGRKESGIFFEISGKSGTGKTMLLIHLAASYLIATDDLESHIHYDHEGNDLFVEAKRSSYSYFGIQAGRMEPPKVVMLDMEYGIRIECIASIVKSCVSNHISSRGLNEKQVDDRFVRILGRINIVQPRDNTDLVCVLESLRFSLDKSKSVNGISTIQNRRDLKLFNSNRVGHSPPLLLMIDGVGAFEFKDRMLEELTGGLLKRSSGLSGAPDFVRQLQRLRDSHNIEIFTTKHTPKPFGGISKKNSNANASSVLLGNLVTHRIVLDPSNEGTQEANAGFQFVAVQQQHDQGRSNFAVTPFSLTSGGVVC